MPIPLEVLEAQVLGLPQAERARLLDKLLASLDVDPEWEEACWTPIFWSPHCCAVAARPVQCCGLA